MAGRAKHLTVAVLLTSLDAAVAVYCGEQIWTVRSGDIWNHALPVLLTAFSVISLANVWAQAVPELFHALADWSPGRAPSRTPIAAAAHGDGNV